MIIPRTICIGIAATTLAMFSLFGNAEAAPRPTFQAGKSVMRIGLPNQSASARGLGFLQCDPLDLLVSENLDMVTVTPGNSVNCFSGSGTPEHRYGRSHDLSLGATAGISFELTCIHFAMAQNSVAGIATVNIYQDVNGVPGPLPDGSDLFEIGSFAIDLPVVDVKLPIALTLTLPSPLSFGSDALIFIEIVIPESIPGTHEIGSNAGGELSSSWIRTTNGECGIGSWVNPALLGFPNMHILEAIEVREAVIPDPCKSPLPNCAADVDQDGIVAVSDVLAVIANWGICGDGTFRPVGDVAPLPNGDCCVNVTDLLAVIADYGVECEDDVITFGINEIRIDQDGFDDDEFVELIGTPGQSLDGYSYIVIGDGVGGSGVLEAVVDLTGLVIAPDGFLSLG